MATKSSADLLPGTLDLLVLRTLAGGPMHGYGIAQRVKEISRDMLQIGESSLYPALQRLALNGYIEAEWGASENNRRARYYTLTPGGRKQLAAERKEFEQLAVERDFVLQIGAVRRKSQPGGDATQETHGHGPQAKFNTI